MLCMYQSCSWSAGQRNDFFPCSRLRQRVQPDRFDHPVQLAARSFSAHGLKLMLDRGLISFLPFSATAPTYILHRQPPLGPSRVYRVTQLRTPLRSLSKVRRFRASKQYTTQQLSPLIYLPVLSTCPLHTSSGCGKERRIRSPR